MVNHKEQMRMHAQHGWQKARMRALELALKKIRDEFVWKNNAHPRWTRWFIHANMARARKYASSALNRASGEYSNREMRWCLCRLGWLDDEKGEKKVVCIG